MLYLFATSFMWIGITLVGIGVFAAKGEKKQEDRDYAIGVGILGFLVTVIPATAIIFKYNGVI